MKKQLKPRKLVIKKELLASLENVSGGAYSPYLNDTVYRPAPTEYQCATSGCGIA
ncbi:MAG TPA: hypothetical protein VIJ61_05275 [Thermoanaerobaculia bacterium]